MNTEKREAAVQTSEEAQSNFLRVWNSRESEKQETAEYLGCSCSIAAL